ncbi:hypothetical protein D3C72_1244360 [compost metagenome]
MAIACRQRDGAAQGLLYLRRNLLRRRFRDAADKAEILLPEASVCLPAQTHTQLRVVAQFRMGVERQVIGKQVDVVLDHALDALLHPPSDAPVIPAPEQAMVHKDGICPGGNGRIDQRARRGHAAHQLADLGLALDLQAVGAVVLESFGLQQGIEGLQHVLAGGRHGAIVSEGNFSYA